MNVFLSWSGERSKRVANMLSDWLSCVIQTCRPWVSTRDIDRGSLWFSEINDKLQATSIGVICLTKENKERPWILFEAGALAKGLNGSRVCTLLIDLSPGEIIDPLAQFNHTLPQKESIYQLVQTLNSSLATGGLNESVLAKVFETYWPQFEADFAKILAETETKSAKQEAKNHTPDAMFTSIMDMLQTMNSRLRRLEKDNSFSNSSSALRSALKNNFHEEKAIDLLKILKNDKFSPDRAIDMLANSMGYPRDLAEELVIKYFKD